MVSCDRDGPRGPSRCRGRRRGHAAAGTPLAYAVGRGPRGRHPPRGGRARPRGRDAGARRRVGTGRCLLRRRRHRPAVVGPGAVARHSEAAAVSGGGHHGPLLVPGGHGNGMPVIPGSEGGSTFEALGLPDAVCVTAEFAALALLVGLMAPAQRRSVTNLLLAVGVCGWIVWAVARFT